jgi:hypothetical protein
MSVQQRQEIFWGNIADSLGALRPPSASSCFHSNFDQGCGLSVFRQVCLSVCLSIYKE